MCTGTAFRELCVEVYVHLFVPRLNKPVKKTWVAVRVVDRAIDRLCGSFVAWFVTQFSLKY